MNVDGHYLPHNKSEWSPRRVITLDTESHQRPTSRGRLHTMRCAAVTYDRRVPGQQTSVSPGESGTFRDPTSLWTWIGAHTDRSESAWVYAHNLDFDLCNSAAIPTLGAMGWEVTDFSTAPRVSFLRMKCGRRRLAFADSASLLPASLRSISKALGYQLPHRSHTAAELDRQAEAESLYGKWPLPEEEDPDAVWERYCRRDTSLLREAILAVMDWWDAEALGHWGLTGPACGWAALRHRFLQERILVHHHPDVTELERAAYFGGRREVFHVGEAQGGPFPYLDFTMHYPNVAAREPIPVQLLGTVGEIPLETITRPRKGIGFIAEVEVENGHDCVPARTDRGVVYGGGRFRTTLAGPELALLADHGHQVRVLRGAYYRLQPALRKWGQWVTGLVGADPPSCPGVVRLAAKAWSHSVLGKFGQVGRQRRVIADCLPNDWGSTKWFAMGEQTHGTITHIAGKTWETTEGGEGRTAAPAIAAWITSAARVELYKLMLLAGKERLLWCDTDAVVITRGPSPDPRVQPGPAAPTATTNGDAEIGFTSSISDAARTVGLPEIQEPSWWLPPRYLTDLDSPLRVKEIFHSFAAWLPGYYRTDHRITLKGVPTNAKAMSGGRFRYELWPGLHTQLQRHHGEGFETWDRSSEVRTTYTRGVVLPGGKVEPLTLELVGSQNRIRGP